MTVPCAFAVGDDWYEMPYSLAKTIQAKFGDNWTNAKIIEYINNHKTDYKFGKIGSITTINPI